jgi:tetratricopeptide (TPR) repeat protein
MRKLTRYLAVTFAAVLLISCSRDPNYLKAKYLQSGKKYYDAGRYKEASIMFRKSIETDRRYGLAYYELALTELKLSQLANAVPALRRAHELIKPGTAEANDTDLKLGEIMVMAAQSQTNNEQIVKDIQQIADGLLARNPNSWEGHKLTGDLDILATGREYRAGHSPEAKKALEQGIVEYRHALTLKPGDSTITLALGRGLVIDGEIAEAQSLFKGMVAKDKTDLAPYYELYRLAVAQRNLPDAEAILKSAIQNNPKNTQLRMALVQFYFATKKQADVLSALNTMKGDLSQFPDAYLQAGDFYMRVGATDDAVKQYEEGIHKDSRRTTTYLKHEIEAYIRGGKLPVANEKNEAILKIDPKDPDARGLKATFLLDKGDVNQAMGELQSVVTARPNNFVARFNLGRAHFARGEYEQARQEFDTAIQLRPDYLPARLAQTQVALIRGDTEAALHDSDELLRVAPNSIQGRVMKAASLQRLGRYDEARQLLEDVLAKQPNQVETLLELGVLDLAQKKNKEAIDLFHRASVANPDNLRGLLGESRAYLLDGQADKAVQLIQEEVQKHPERLDLIRELGNTQAGVGQFEAAIQTYQGLLARTTDPRQQADLLVRISQAAIKKGDLQQSINSMEKAHQDQPNNAPVMVNLAMLYELQKKPDIARKYYEQSIKVDPNNALALNNLAYLITESNGDLDQALTYATRAKQVLPKFPEINDTLGWIYLKKNLTDNALDTFRDLVVQAPQSPVYHYHYAMALLQKGDRETAKKECQSALADKPSKDQLNDIHILMAKL